MTQHKGLALITLLAAWELWNDRNTRVFKYKHAPPPVILEKKKYDSKLWALAAFEFCCCSSVGVCWLVFL
jgi:hypothetical protein